MQLNAYWETLDPVFEWTPQEKQAYSFAFLRHRVIPKRSIGDGDRVPMWRHLTMPPCRNNGTRSRNERRNSTTSCGVSPLCRW